MQTLLSLEGLSIWLPSCDGPVNVVHEVDLSVGRGEVVAVVGESGCGKTLTALSLLHLLPRGAVTEGVARFDGRDLLRLRGRGLRAVRGGEIGVVFQDPMTSLHPMLTIERQLTEHVRHHLGLRRSSARTRALELLEQVRLPDPARTLRLFPHQLSGGMRQRVAIAIALACRPRLLIADEPTTALDVTVQAGILGLLEELRRTEGLSILLITHDIGVTSAVADRVYVFYGGRVVETGALEDVVRQPAHPYARALLAARPDPNDSTRMLMPIAGSPPAPGAMPSGCVFHPRCPIAVASCADEEPLLSTIGGGRACRCPFPQTSSGVSGLAEVSRT